MSNITPNDILEKDFKKKLNGYDPLEVKDFLEHIASFLSSLIKENNLLKSRVISQKAQIEAYIKKEMELMNALVTAQRFSDDLKGQAEKEADFILQRSKLEAESITIDAKKEYDTIIRNAKIDAEKLIRDSNRKAINMESRLNELKRLREENLFRLRSTLEWFNRMLLQEERGFDSPEVIDFSDIDGVSKTQDESYQKLKKEDREAPEFSSSPSGLDNPLEESVVIKSEVNKISQTALNMTEKKMQASHIEEIKNNEIISWFEPTDKDKKDNNDPF
jgi:DivIVA domain-containing protein